MKSTRKIPATVPRRCPKGHLPILELVAACTVRKKPRHGLVWTAAEGDGEAPLPGFWASVA